MKDHLSFLANADMATIEQMYQEYLSNPDSVESGWKNFFEGFEFARKTYHQSSQSGEIFSKEFKVYNLINGYRHRGHLFTKTNPVRSRRIYCPNLNYENFDLQKEDLDIVFKAGEEIGMGPSKLSDIIDKLKSIYCSSIGLEFMFIRQPDKINWFLSKVETNNNSDNFTQEEKKHILFKLCQAVEFEQFLHKKYPAQKRFSLAGAESIIPALDAVIEKGAELGIQEYVIGMAHRGRINVLANILNKSYQDIFNEFDGSEYDDGQEVGDVKYHLGYSSDILSKNGHNIHISLSPNPSHLEAVCPVVEGISRAKTDLDYSGEDNKIAPIIIHGDAAIAAQGVVYETIQMAQLKGFKTGGTIHFVINNQVGFTTDYLDGRSSTYCTDIAKTTLSPVFHVNGDDPEALVHTIKIAMEFRQEFKSDIFIDILCYRKYGHNEGDEPRFTQPLLYKAIETHPDPMTIYAEHLLEEKVINEDYLSKMNLQINELLNEKLTDARAVGKSHITPIFKKNWEKTKLAIPSDFDQSPDTGFDKTKLAELGIQLNTLPANKKFYDKTIKLHDRRRQMITEGKALDWAVCEQLSLATLLTEGTPVRFSGQDSERGTFSHRHAVLTLEDSTETYIPLSNISHDQASFHIYNSHLSEYGVLGFEFGYSLVHPNPLILWEAQFGDFANVAQVIFDQFISSCEEKWKLQTGLVVLLPHGYEGQGSEHSSARIERFLILSADYNQQVVNCTTPANFFHVLRRQVYRNFRKPLIVFTPKSLLRHPACVSSLEDLAEGKFMEMIDDTEKLENVRKVILCSGKIYYDLQSERLKKGINDVAIIRLEQLFPLPVKQLNNLIQKYKPINKWLWVQEEPENMGAWPYIQRKFRDIKLEVIARPETGAPASGLYSIYLERQNNIISEALK